MLALVVGVHAQKADLIQSTSPFSPNATITFKPNSQCVALRTIPEAKRSPKVREALQACASKGTDKLEVGTVNGVAYRFYYSDGSGSFAHDPRVFADMGAGEYLDSWQVSCEKDPITDDKACYMDRGDTRVWIDARGRSELYIGSSHYPGSQVVIRIDKSAPLAIRSRTFGGSFGYRASPTIINKITSAATVTTRYQKWPYKDYEDETWSTYGFKEALAYIRWAVARIK